MSTVSLSAVTPSTAAPIAPPVTFHALTLPGEGDRYALALTSRGAGDLTLSRVTASGEGAADTLRTFAQGIVERITDGGAVTLAAVELPASVKVRASGRLPDMARAMATGLIEP